MSSFDPSLTSLRALCSLANTGNVSLTAAELGLTQPAVSRSISTLENLVGLTLVQRSTRPLELTREGEIVAAHAHDLNLIIAALGERLADLRRNRAGSVRIGSFGASASSHILPPLVKRFSKRYPAVMLNILEADDDQTLDNLQRGLVDMAFLADPGDEFETVPVATDRLVGLVPSGSPLAGRDELTQGDLASQPFIMTQGGSESYILDWFGQAGIEPQVTHRVLQAHSIVALVKASLGNAIVASLSLPEPADGVCRVPLVNAGTNQLVMARTYQSPYSNAADLFWRHMVEILDR